MPAPATPAAPPRISGTASAGWTNTVPASTGMEVFDAGYGRFDLHFPLAPGVPQVTLHGQWLVLGSGATAPGASTGGSSWGH